MNLFNLVLVCSLFVSIWSHPVWDVSQILGNVTESDISDIDAESDLDDPENGKAILGIIDSIVNGRLRIKCATGQGQEGKCTIGSCATLGEGMKAVNCPGKLASFLKCCPNEPATEVTPSKVQGKYIYGDSMQTHFGLAGCGIRPMKTSNLIVGGDEATPNSWPWAIALYRKNGDRKFFQCGGSIINERYILTAAHCIKRPFQTLTASDFVVKVGAHYLAQSGQFVELESIIAHENYSPSYHNDDVALLKLQTALNFEDSNVSPVCLPELGSTVGRETGQVATMVGWGVHNQTDFASSPALYEVNIPISDHEQCKSTYTELMGQNNYLDWNNVVCASFAKGGKDTCQGDSGGPMTIPNTNQVYTQFGIVSFGYGCAQEGYPGVYTYVPNYLNWIGSHMSK